MKPRSTQRKKSAVARASQSAGRSDYRAWSGGIAALLAEARRQSARSVNAILTATYWEIGRRIVEFVQQGETRAEYGDEVCPATFARFDQTLWPRLRRSNQSRHDAPFFPDWPPEAIIQTLSEQFEIHERAYKLFRQLSEQFVGVSNLPDSVWQICQQTILQTLSAELEILWDSVPQIC